MFSLVWILSLNFLMELSLFTMTFRKGHQSILKMQSEMIEMAWKQIYFCNEFIGHLFLNRRTSLHFYGEILIWISSKWTQS